MGREREHSTKSSGGGSCGCTGGVFAGPDMIWIFNISILPLVSACHIPAVEQSSSPEVVKGHFLYKHTQTK